MDGRELINLIRVICQSETHHADISEIIQKEYSKLEFNPHRSKERSRALQAVTKSRSTRSTEYASNDFFWLALQPWASCRESSVLLLNGLLSLQGRIEKLAVETIDLISTRPVTLIWALNVPPKQGDGDGSKKYASRDIVAQLCLQLLLKNPRLHIRCELEKCLSVLERSTCDSDWFTAILHFIDGLDQVYIVVDLDSMGRRSSESTNWPEAFTSLFRTLTQVTIKVVLFTCGASASLYQNPAQVHVIQFPTENTRVFRSKDNIRSKKSRQTPNNPDASTAWLQHVGDSRRKRTIAPLDDTGDSGGGMTMTPSAPKRRRKPHTWHDSWTDFNSPIEYGRKDEPSREFPRVKVAVLDTGVDLLHPDIAEARQEGRLKYHDFISNDSTMCDTDGHGTHCASLLLKYAPNAEIYVGRVFEKTSVRPSRIATLADAVKFAVENENWKVDIISISLGFQDSTEEAEQVFELAAARRVLIFASASNNTIHEVQPIRFPANMRQVFCIFAADDRGLPSTFNPKGTYECPNFMLPGENILGAWPTDLSKGKSDAEVLDGKTYRRLSGTSCATPIAAAIAAEIMEFAWQPRETPFRRVDLLKRFDGMEKVFIRMADRYQPGDGCYHYVLPWKVLTRRRTNKENQVLLNSCVVD